MSLGITSQKLGLFKRHYILTGFLVFIFIVVGWWKYEFPSATWRYKMTVVVETPEGLKTGYAVRQIGQYTDINIGDVGGGAAGATGEAVVVDLGKRGKLFMTIGEDFYFIFEAFPFDGANTPAGMEYYSHLKDAKASILKLERTVPQLVMFTDLNDPKTVRSIDLRKLSATFGAGVYLQDITVETTDEPMTLNVVDQALPWLSSLHGGYLDGKFLGGGPQLSNILHAGNFKTGVKYD